MKQKQWGKTHSHPVMRCNSSICGVVIKEANGEGEG